MKHPPYHLRVNKAVDRAALVDAIGLLAGGDPSDYTYYGMGGPFLEDHRLLHATYPQMKLVSIEADEETYKRQQFHRPCSDHVLRLRHETFSSFLSDYDPQDEKCVVWADYTGLTYEHVDNFMALLQKVTVGSMVKVTLEADPRRYRDPEAKARFRSDFEAVLTPGTEIPPHDYQFAAMVQDMLHTAAQFAFEGIHDREFQPVASLRYRDGAGMYTLTGVLCTARNRASFRARFRRWPFANLDWAPPSHVDLPELTTKERQHLENLLPCEADAGRTLQRRLGYLIDEDRDGSIGKLDQWARHHRYAATFVKAAN